MTIQLYNRNSEWQYDCCHEGVTCWIRPADYMIDGVVTACIEHMNSDDDYWCELPDGRVFYEDTDNE